MSFKLLLPYSEVIVGCVANNSEYDEREINLLRTIG